MNIDVIPAIRDHLEFILKSQLDMAVETEGLHLCEDTVRKGVTAVFDNPNNGRYVVAELDGKPVGVLLIVNEWSDWRNANVLWVHSLYVLKEHRGKGVYKTMYRQLQNEVMNDVGLGGIRLNVDKGNPKATKVYQALGMSDDHYRMFEWLKD